MSIRGGVADLLKDGVKYLSGVDEAVIKNIEAVKNLAQITKTSIGPNGMNKMVINHLEKLFVTHDAATILEELEVVHPAAKMVVMASKAQRDEVGDATNLVVILAGELLAKAENLLTLGLVPSEIIDGYTIALDHAVSVLNEISVDRLEDIHNQEEVSRVLRSVIKSKINGYEDVISRLTAEACVAVCPKKSKKFGVDNVRVLKVEGSSISKSQLVYGFAIARDVAGTVRSVKNAKVAVFGCPFEASSTDTKGVVELSSADELKNYNRTEEDALERIVEEISQTGVNVVVVNGNISELAMHFLEKHDIMAVRLPSKFDIRRLCLSIGAISSVRLGAPTPEEVGYCRSVECKEIGDTNVVVFDRGEEDGAGVCTIVVRGATHNAMDDVERAIDDAVNVYKTLCKDNRLCTGAGASEIAIARRLKDRASSVVGIEQYSIKKFGEAFEAVPRQLAENVGMKVVDSLASLYAAHKNQSEHFGVDIENSSIADLRGQVLDSVYAKEWAIRFATDAVLNILRVDQIIMAKPAGGPKPRDPLARDD